MKKVSLILTTFNSEGTILKTLLSIVQQDYPDIEVVIKDGQSIDNTIRIIEEFKEEYSIDIILYSAKDSGIYDAMNQGYNRCSGDIIAFFNDEFATNTAVSKMVSAIESNPTYVGAHSDLVYIKENKIIRYWKSGQGPIKQGWMPGHPTLFLKREIYEKYGLYDTSYRCSADYEFMIRFLKDDNKLNYVPEVLVKMFYGGTSTNGMSSYILSMKEGHWALKKNSIRNAYIIDVKRIIKVFLQFLKKNNRSIVRIDGREDINHNTRI